MVLGIQDALKRFENRFQFDKQLNHWSVIAPITWLALLEHNQKYCPLEEAKLLSEASLAVRPV
ncbi:hypothetical protein [Legionella sp. W05-934-2]|uniref:hypothetical protein n=1 Tax=Legionella sp. W05-934-2 TaxID=1198649 RepID=UPI0034623B22